MFDSDPRALIEDSLARCVPRRAILKQLVAMGLALPAASALLDACSGQAAGGSSAKVTISLWTHTHPPMIQLMKTLIKEYEARHEGVTIDYQQIPNNEFGPKMLTALSSGSGPDVINMDDVSLRGDYIPKGLVVPVDPKALGYESVEALTSRYIPGAFVGATGGDGKIYGVPLEYDAAAFGFHFDQFQEAGLDPSSPPRTWGDVATMGRQLVQYQGGTMVRQGFDFLYLHSGWYTDFIELLLHQTGGHILNSQRTASVIAQSRSVQALTIWNDLINKYHVGDPHVSSTDATVPYSDFYTGKLSMTVLIGPWAQAQMQQTYAGQYRQVKMAAVPQVDPSRPASRCYGYFMAVNKASKVQEEAWKFIAYVTSQHDRWLSDVLFVQPIKGWQNTAAARKIDFIDVWAESYATAKFDEVGPHWSEIEDTLKSSIQDTVFNGVPPETSFTRAQSEIDRILKG
ncbi:MAG TPA: extracellular solute-binding protein [Candidatus Dormibacteraeota bacterium]|nr:extracellular solute-binding protein [Candidatus Dormibacteraeota bacterium]